MFEKINDEREYRRKFNANPDGRTPNDLPSPVLLSGTQVVTGEGWFLVIVVGENSQIGMIMSQIGTEIEQTPLQDKLERIAYSIGVMGMTVALLTV